MIWIPSEIHTDFEVLLKEKVSGEPYRIHYRKWLRYYRDFCHKYGHCAADWKNLCLFAGKRRQKCHTGRSAGEKIQKLRQGTDP